MAASTTDFSKIMTVMEFGKELIGIEEAKYYNELAKIWRDLLKEYASSGKLVDPVLQGFFALMTEGKVPKFDIPASVERVEQKSSKDESGDPKYSDYQDQIDYALNFLEFYKRKLKKGDSWASEKIWINLSYTLVGNQYTIHAMDYLLKNICFYYSPIGEKQFEECNNTLEFISQFMERFAIYRQDNNYKRGYQQTFEDLKSARDALKKCWNKQIAAQKLEGIKKHAKAAENCLRLAIMLVYPNMEVINNKYNIRLANLKKGIILSPIKKNQKIIKLPKKKGFLFQKNLTTVIQNLHLNGLYPGDKKADQKGDAFKPRKMVYFPVFLEKEKNDYLSIIRSRFFSNDNWPYLMAFSAVTEESNKLTEIGIEEFNDRVKIVEDLLNLALALNDLARLSALSSHAAHSHGQLAILSEKHYESLFNAINAIRVYFTEKLENVSKKLNFIFDSVKNAEGDFEINEVISPYKELLNSIVQKVHSCGNLISELEANRKNFKEILEESQQNDKELEEALRAIEECYLVKVISCKDELMNSPTSKGEAPQKTKTQSASECKLEEKKSVLQSACQQNYNELIVKNVKNNKLGMISSRQIKEIFTREEEKKSSSIPSCKTEDIERLPRKSKFAHFERCLGGIANFLLEDPQSDFSFFNHFYDEIFASLDHVKNNISEKEQKDFFTEYKIPINSFPSYVRNNWLARWFYDTEYKVGQLLVNNLVISSIYKKLKKQEKLSEIQFFRYKRLINSIKNNTEEVKATLSNNRFVNWWRDGIKDKFESFLTLLKERFKFDQSNNSFTNSSIFEGNKISTQPISSVLKKSLNSNERKKQALSSTLSDAPKEILFQSDEKAIPVSLDDNAILDSADKACRLLDNLRYTTDHQRLIVESYRCILVFWQELIDYAKKRDRSPIEKELKDKIISFHERDLIKIPKLASDMSPLAKVCFESIIPKEDYFISLVDFRFKTINLSLRGEGTSILDFLKNDLSKKLILLKESHVFTLINNCSLNLAC